VDGELTDAEDVVGAGKGKSEIDTGMRLMESGGVHSRDKAKVIERND